MLLGPKHDATAVPVAAIAYISLCIFWSSSIIRTSAIYENIFEFVQVMCKILRASFFRIYSVLYIIIILKCLMV